MPTTGTVACSANNSMPPPTERRARAPGSACSATWQSRAHHDAIRRGKRSCVGSASINSPSGIARASTRKGGAPRVSITVICRSRSESTQEKPVTEAEYDGMAALRVQLRAPRCIANTCRTTSRSLNG
jgi:hypothetical protein